MATYKTSMQLSLRKWLGTDNVVFMKGWGVQKRIPWQGAGKVPVALLVHHTAGAVTQSTDPSDPGNQKGANSGQVSYIQNHFEVPAANFTLDRDGTVYVHSVFPVWHAGLGEFKGWPYASLGIPKNEGNDFMLGVECVSKGLKKDFTRAQKRALGELAQACVEASGWKGTVKRLPNHRTWAPNRKPDTKYKLSALLAWAKWAGVRGPKDK